VRLQFCTYVELILKFVSIDHFVYDRHLNYTNLGITLGWSFFWYVWLLHKLWFVAANMAQFNWCRLRRTLRIQITILGEMLVCQMVSSGVHGGVLVVLHVV